MVTEKTEKEVRKAALETAKATGKSILKTLDVSALFLLYKSFRDETTEYFGQASRFSDYMAEIVDLLPIEDRTKFVGELVEDIKHELQHKLDKEIFSYVAKNNEPLWKKFGLLKNVKQPSKEETKEAFKFLGNLLQKKGWKPNDSQKERLEKELKEYFEPFGFNVEIEFCGENTNDTKEEPKEDKTVIKGDPTYLRGFSNDINDFKESEAWDA